MLSSRRITLYLIFSWIPALVHSQGMPPSAWMEAAEEQHCGTQVPVTVHIHNDSKTRFDTFWLHPKERRLQQVTQEPVNYKTTAPYHTHVNMMFEFHEVPNENTGECAEMVCRRSHLRVEEEGDENNVYKLNKNFELVKVEELEAKAYLGEVIESNIHLKNLSRTPINFYFVQHDGGELLKLSTLAKSQEKKYNSYATNSFMVEETGPCEKDDSCRTNRFTNPPNHPYLSVTEDFQILLDGKNIGEED